ncbi:hypothetical protein OROHE_002750 [Orobanche hederae]
MAEMASIIYGHMGIQTPASKNHPTYLSFVAWVANHWAKLPNPMSNLAGITIRACTSFLPFVTQLSLEHPLVTHYHHKRDKCVT